MEPSNACRFGELHAPAYGLSDAPVVLHRSPQKRLVNSDLSSAKEGLQDTVSSSDPRLHFVFRKECGAVGAFTTHIDDILGCGEPGVLGRTQGFLEARLGQLKLQESPCVHAGIELPEEKDYTVRLAQAEFSPKLDPVETPPALWAAPRQPLYPDDALRRQCKLGEPCWLAPASRPDICANRARLTSKANSLQGIDIYRITDLIRTVQVRQPGTGDEILAAVQVWRPGAYLIEAGHSSKVCTRLPSKWTGAGGCGWPHPRTV